MSTSTRPTPAEALQRLRAGNARFVAGASEHPNQDAARRESLTDGQHPFAVIFGCSDSRLAAEIIFDLGLGDTFVVRTAGQVVGNAALGSLEYSVTDLDVPLIVVLGHDSCGAVTAASGNSTGFENTSGTFRAPETFSVSPFTVTCMAVMVSSNDGMAAPGSHVRRHGGGGQATLPGVIELDYDRG